MNEIARRLINLNHHLAALEKQYGRPPGSVRLLAVTKKQSVATIQTAIHAGIRLLGENYLQEALEKIPALASFSPEWHFIGQIQSNKTRQIAAHFAWAHSVTSHKLARQLHEHRPDHCPPLNICLQLNLNPGDGRGGIDEKELPDLAEYCSKLDRICLRGLMALPCLSNDPIATRDAFHRLQIAYIRLQALGFSLDTLSAGTSEDFEAAIAEGATLIRVGTALFGSRQQTNAV